MADLWIRSQNKEVLSKYNRLAVSQVAIKSSARVMGLIDNDFGWETLGEYKTKERALEVLDEIQSILSDEVFVFKNFSFDKTEDVKKFAQIIGTRCIAIQDNTNTVPTVDFKNKNCIVYSMPKE